MSTTPENFNPESLLDVTKAMRERYFGIMGEYPTLQDAVNCARHLQRGEVVVYWSDRRVFAGGPTVISVSDLLNK